MNYLLEHFRRLPRIQLQREIRRIIANANLYLWEYLPMGSIYGPVRAGPETAAKLGVADREVIGYFIAEGGGPMTGCAIGDLMNAVQEDPPYPDPFAGGA